VRTMLFASEELSQVLVSGPKRNGYDDFVWLFAGPKYGGNIQAFEAPFPNVFQELVFPPADGLTPRR